MVHVFGDPGGYRWLVGAVLLGGAHRQADREQLLDHVVAQGWIRGGSPIGCRVSAQPGHRCRGVSARGDGLGGRCCLHGGTGSFLLQVGCCGARAFAASSVLFPAGVPPIPVCGGIAISPGGTTRAAIAPVEGRRLVPSSQTAVAVLRWAGLGTPCWAGGLLVFVARSDDRGLSYGGRCR